MDEKPKHIPPANWRRRRCPGYVIGILSPATGKFIWIPLTPLQGGAFEYEAGLHGLKFRGSRYKDRTKMFGMAMVRLVRNRKRSRYKTTLHAQEALA